ncbi:hypothetical protein PENTCL1PPCAC_11613, partial [Pristionchus entomophagus]
ESSAVSLTSRTTMSSDIPGRRDSPRKHKAEDTGKLVKNEECAEQSASIVGTTDRRASETVKRGPGRPRKSSFTSPPTLDANVGSDVSSAEGRRSTRIRATQGQYAHHDQTYDASSGMWRCLVPGCNWMSDSRATRSFHLRTDHPQYKDLGELMCMGGDQREEIATGRNARVVGRSSQIFKIPSFESLSVKPDEGDPIEEHHIVEDDEELVEDNDIESEGEEDIEEMIDPSYDRSDAEEELMAMREEGARMESARNAQGKRGRGRPRKGEFDPPGPNSRLRISDPKGRYPCYVEGCDWKGGYRSVRSAHMKHMHRDWVRPPSFTLLRVSREGHVITPLNDETPKYECIVEGCPWKGNYKASRMAHIRNHHKNIELPTRKTQSGGYVANGRYACHDPRCDWRGSSRSTRSNHMKKEHRNFVNTVYSARNVLCCDCGVSLQSHKNFVDHMVCEHNVGGIVQREFNDPRDYEEWFDAVQESFSIDFIKKMGVKQTTQYQVLYLYCAKGGGYRDPRFHRYNKNAITPVRLPLRRRPNRGMVKCGKNCAAFLRVLNWADGRLTVIGCVEHTGHRMGTPLLRLSPYERDVMDEYLYSMDPSSPIECVLDRLREQEGFQADGWECTEKTPEDLKQYITDEDEVTSLHSLLQSHSIRDSTFGIVLPSKANNELSIGFMDESQRKLWEHHNKIVAINEVRLCLSHFDIHIYTALVFDNQNQPRIAATYMTTSEKRAPLMHHLKQVWPEIPDTIVTDCSQDWEGIIHDVYQHAAYRVDHQIAEWHLLQEWAICCDQTIANRVDRFTIICALRRWVRASHPVLFESMMGDLFDALREMDLDEFGTYIDNQLTDPSHHKRWTPTVRNPITDANNPILELTCRTIREKFVNNDVCKRMDEFVGFYLERMNEFNQCTIGEVYSTGNVEPQRTVNEWMEEERDEHDMEMEDMDPLLLPCTSHVYRDEKGHEEDDDMDVHPEMVEIMEEEMEGGVYHEEIVVDASELDGLETEPGPSSGLMRLSRMDGRGRTRGSRGSRGETITVNPSPRKLKLIEMIKKRMEDANEEDLEMYENNITQMERMKGSSNAMIKRSRDIEEIGEGVEEEEGVLIEEEIVQT